MEQQTFFCAGSTPAAKYASEILRQNGWIMHCTPAEDTQSVLLDVPSMTADGKLRGGASIQELLSLIPQDAIIMGGALNHPVIAGRTTFDLLKDESYLMENAKITAYCTLPIIFSSIPATVENIPILIIGWGRIGRVLAQLLHLLKADVTAASRKQENAAEIQASGLKYADTFHIPANEYRVIINTAPAPVKIPSPSGNAFPPVKIDLASVNGLSGSDVIRARGLPGIHAPESSGKLIANTILTHMKERPV